MSSELKRLREQRDALLAAASTVLAIEKRGHLASCDFRDEGEDCYCGLDALALAVDKA